MSLRRTCLLAIVFFFSNPDAKAQETRVGDIVISMPWSRETPKGAKVGAGYLVIANRGSTPDRLIEVTSKVSARIELHEMATRDGVMTMRPLAGIVIAPGQSVTLAPGGSHLMFMNLKEPFTRGTSIDVVLRFEKAGSIAVSLPVQPIGAGPPAAHAGH